MKKILILLVGAALLLGLYYVEGRDYLSGKEWHYLGASEITPVQLSQLAINETIGYEYIKCSELLENGLVKIDYGFYSKEQYYFLEKSAFSFFDTKFCYTFKSVGTFIAGVSGAGKVACIITLGFLCLVILANSKSKSIRMKASNVLWYIVHPFSFLGGKKPENLHTPLIADEINVNCDAAGIICARSWKYKKSDGYLYSVGMGQMRYTNKTMTADKTPGEDNESGLYAFRLGIIIVNDYTREILGIGSLKGNYCEHEDGVLRGESYEILHLVISKSLSRYADKLSSVYGVTVSVVDDITNAYCRWLTSKNGLDAMQHNLNILEGKNGDKSQNNPEG